MKDYLHGIRKKNISFDNIPTNTDTACCFAWKVDTETGEGLDTYYYGGGCGAGEWIEAAEAQVKLKRLKTKCLEASLLLVNDQEDEYDEC